MERIVDINSKTCVFAVIGSPIGHSVSPQLHNAISIVTGKNFVYCAFNVEPENLEDAIKGMRAFGIKGINVTVPHKEQVVRYLDGISPEAQIIGAVNTVVNCSGRLLGYNTDAAGLRQAVSDMGFDWRGKNVLILGAGGTAKAAGYAAYEAGAACVCFCNRTGEKARLLAEKYTGTLARRPGYFSWTTPEQNDFSSMFREFDLVINTTPAGMSPNEHQMPIPGSLAFGKNQAVFDVIYKPARTLFLEKAEQAGCRTANGLGMLFHQGIRASEIWQTWDSRGWVAEGDISMTSVKNMPPDAIQKVKNIFMPLFI